MREAGSERTEARVRSLLWMESLWNDGTTTAWEEDRKEEVLAVFRELARQAEHGVQIREYVP